MGDSEPDILGQSAGFVLGTAYVLLFAFLFSLGDDDSISVLEFVSIAMLVITPLSVGFITVVLSTREQAASRKYKLYSPWVPVIVWSLISLSFAWETIICIAMILPLYLPLASMGGIIGANVRLNHCDKTKFGVLSCFSLLPLLVAPIESPIQSPTIRHAVEDAVVIDAPIDQVWNSLANIEDIQASELRWNLSHALGLPRPVAARTKNFAVGAVRELYWEKGVHFQELITRIEENRLLAYEVLVDEDSMQIAELDTHITVGDQYFDVESGCYRLQSMNGKTQLSLTTTYRMTSKVNWYGRLWANYVLDDFHKSVLNLIKHRNESHRSDQI
ncbi:MAG: hypothetical protein KKC01_09030 [Gammaproteobacteria bacterium]|nr:hypothetical protein [Gammaproteobacteria bacterium]